MRISDSSGEKFRLFPTHISGPWGGNFYFPPIFRDPGGEVKKPLPPQMGGKIKTPGKTLLTFGINELCVRGSRRRFYYSKKQLTRCIHSKIVTYKFKVELSLCETVARRRRIFLRISASKLYFVKENKRGNSPPQAKNFKDLRC